VELIGRERETTEVLAMLAEGPRVVTLWGPGGIGKTSLARAISRASALPGGDVFVPMASARTASDLYAIAAGTLMLGAAATRTEEEEVMRIGRAIAARGRTLVVLDNAEQIVAEVAHAVASWSAAAPECTFLITSRTLLGVSSEIAYELLPLRLDNAEVPDAVKLLEARARAVRPSFQADRDSLARIAERVEGIPLAIELAAARLAVMSATQLLARLGDRLEVLKRDHAGAEQRQRTLRSTIAWSWDLLGEDERAALAELTPTRGFDVEAAEAIVTGDAIALVAALRQQSLLAPQATEPPRFFILDTIREFAALERPEDERRGADRCAAFHAKKALEHVARLRGEGGEAAMAALATESDNLVAIVERFCAEPRAEIATFALQALVGLESVLASRGASVSLAELGRKTIEASDAFEIAGNDRARALVTLGTALLATGRLADACDAFERANGLASGATLARTAERLAAVLWAEGRNEEALVRADEALALTADTPALRAQCLSTRGVILHTRDRFEDARACYESALTLARELGDRRGELLVRSRLGFLLHDFGDPAAALEQYTTARALGLPDASLDGYVGNARRATGDITGAVADYGSAIAQLRRAGNRMLEATFTMDRGIAWSLAARWDEALRDLESAVVMSREVGSTRLSVLTLGYLVTCHASRGEMDLARRVLEEARRIAAAPEQEILSLHEGHLLSPSEARARLAGLATPVLGQHRRVAAELLERAIDRVAPPEDALVFDGSQITVRGATIRLGAAKLGVVRLLVERRLAKPGEPVSAADLIAAGWPDERIARTAAVNRLRVLVSGLRSDGVREIESAEGGYRLAPATRVVRTD
jgi:tetratricopeptide (TPR) repeat protein